MLTAKSQSRCHARRQTNSRRLSTNRGRIPTLVAARSSAGAGFPPAEDTKLIAALHLLRKIADVGAGGRKVIAELVFAIGHVVPFLVEPDDGVRGSGELLGTRAGESARENGEHFFSINHENPPRLCA